MRAQHSLLATLAVAIACTTVPVTLVAAETVIKILVEKEESNEQAKPPFKGKRPTVDVAILLDTSNSMDGLISQAKAQLWKIVNRFADAKKSGLTPTLRVALFEYGNTRLPATEGYIRQVLPLTNDLDKLSEALFALTTSGGDEYCGQVIGEAIKRLAWSEEPGSYKAIFIAGNEPFTQGQIDYRKTCKQAIEKGIVVNTIHCGGYDTGVSGQWAHGAQLAEGEYFNIDQDQAVERIATPHDEIIIRLSSELNQTYLWYGNRARAYASNQSAQDANALKLAPAVAAQRAASKSSSNYNYAGRCLVDSYLADERSIAEVPKEQLPEELRKLSGEELKAKVVQLAAQRAELQKKIKDLTLKRDTFVAEARKQQAESTGGASLGDAVVEAIDQQLKAAGYDKK